MRKIILRINDTRRKVAFELIRQGTNTEVVKVLTEDSEIGVAAEYEWIRFRNPESKSWHEKAWQLTKRQIDGKKTYCDILTFISESGTVKKFVFNISSFFGKDGRKKEKYTGSEYLDAAAVTAKFNLLVSKYEEKETNEFAEMLYSNKGKNEFEEALYNRNLDKYIAEKNRVIMNTLQNLRNSPKNIPKFKISW